jgi:hypothetical protein
MWAAPDQEVSQYRSVVGSVPLRRQPAVPGSGRSFTPLKAVGQPSVNTHHRPPDRKALSAVMAAIWKVWNIRPVIWN